MTARRVPILYRLRRHGLSIAAAIFALIVLAPAHSAAQDAAQDHDETDRSVEESDSLRAAKTLKPDRQEMIHITDAELGIGRQSCDVTALMRQKCDGRASCALQVNRGLCPGHDFVGMIQPLKVSYLCRAGEVQHLVTAEEPRQLRLLCGASR